MTITITRRGVAPEPITHRVVCRVCTTEFTFHKSDGVVTRDAYGHGFINLECPVCHEPVAKAWVGQP
jgi:hypothetical protein